jgi:hypothetical protein
MVSRLAVHKMSTRPVDLATAAAIETAEARAWVDLYEACPPGWARDANQGLREIGGALALHWGATGRRYFSRAIGLGVTVPGSEQTIDAILGLWDELGIDMWLVQSLPHCQPAEYEDWLRARGLEPFDRQDRIVRGGEPLAADTGAVTGRELRVERVSGDSAGEWDDFLQHVYGLDTGPWLPELIGRPGWHQFIVREEGELVAARCMYIGADGLAWLGMDGPVPGIMTEDYEPDAALCRHIVEYGLAHGARGFLADIEAPSEHMDTPAYEHFGRLGFGRPYIRTHWARR